MKPRPELSGLDIVIIGSFNPAIFHPAWFAKNSLIMSSESETARVTISNADVTDFSLDWLNCRVFQERFQLSTNQEPYFDVLKDLALSTFILLPHTPIIQLGINFQYHYPLKSEEAWHKVGNSLAPKSFWSKHLRQPGMKIVTIQGERQDDEKGFMFVRVEPSVRVTFGIYMMFTDHYELNPENEIGNGAIALNRILTKNWESSQQKAREIAEDIVTIGDGNYDSLS
jgi:hypothetical protein